MLEDIKKFIVKNGIAIIFGILVLLILVLYCLFPHIGDAMTSIGTAVVAISVIFLFYQIKISKSVAISDFVAKIDGEFFSPEMLKSRKEIAQLDFTKKYEDTRACEDILDFFEKIAYLEEKGHLVEVVDWAKDDFFQSLSPVLLAKLLRNIYCIMLKLKSKKIKKIL